MASLFKRLLLLAYMAFALNHPVVSTAAVVESEPVTALEEMLNTASKKEYSSMGYWKQHPFIAKHPDKEVLKDNIA